MAYLSKVILYLAFMSPALLLFFMSAIYDKSFSLTQIAIATVIFLFIFLIKG